MSFRTRVFWFTAVAALSCPGPARAAETAAAADVKPEVITIAPAYIPEQANQDERFAQRVAERSSSFDADGALATRLAQIHNGVTTLASAYSPQQLRELTAPRLNSLENYWRLYDRQLDQWQSRVQELTAHYSSDAGELAQRQAAWEATLASGTTNAIAPALLARVNEILDLLRKTQHSISEPLNQAINLGRRGNQVRAEFDAGQRVVSQAIGTYTRRLTITDMPPLWDIDRTRREMAGLRAATDEAGLSIENSFVRHFVGERWRELVAFGAAWLASLPLFFWFAWRESQRRLVDGSAPPAAPVLRRPISGCVLFGTLCMPLAFPTAPIALQQAMLMLGLIPVLRLLPGEVFRLLRWLPYAIVTLYFAHRARVLLWDDPLYYRLHLVTMDVCAAAIGLWLLIYSTHRPSIVQGRRRAFLRALGWLSVGALIAALIANMVGNVSLAEMLTSGVIESAYMGLAIYAGMAALFAIGTVLLVDPADPSGFLARNITPLIPGLRRLVQVAAVTLWIVIAVDQFQIYRPTREWLAAALTHPLTLGGLSITLGGVLIFVLSVWVALWIARAVRVLLQNEVLAHMHLPAGVATSIASLTYYALMVIGFLAALVASGFHLSQLTIVLGALSVGIGLGLQGVVANFVSGLILMFERPIRPGDVVEVAGTVGRVREIGMRATTLQTFEGADVVVPNGTLLTSNLTNWTLSNTNRRIDLDVGVSYAADPPAVQLLLVEVARTIPGISTTPQPLALFLRFNSSSLDFGIRAWTSDFENWRTIHSALGIAVHRALQQAGIEIPFPQQDVHLNFVDESAQEKLVAAATQPADNPARRNPD